MRWFLSVLATLLLILGIASNAFAATPDGKTAATAVPLPVSVSASGTLTGSAKGSFAYYTFDYPGKNSTGTITLNVTPTDSNLTNAFGVNLYQDGVALRSINALGATSGSNLGLFSSPTAGPVLAQVYNYLPGQTASYNLTATGVGGVTGIAPPSGSGGETAATAVSLPALVRGSGTLTGSAEGSFAFYTFDYPGNGAIGTITLNVTPTDPNLTNAVGVNLYQNGVSLRSMNALGATSGKNVGQFSSPTAGPILVQVYNYLPGQTASYNFTVTGATQ